MHAFRAWWQSRAARTRVHTESGESILFLGLKVVFGVCNASRHASILCQVRRPLHAFRRGDLRGMKINANTRARTKLAKAKYVAPFHLRNNKKQTVRLCRRVSRMFVLQKQTARPVAERCVGPRGGAQFERERQRRNWLSTGRRRIRVSSRLGAAQQPPNNNNFARVRSNTHTHSRTHRGQRYMDAARGSRRRYTTRKRVSFSHPLCARRRLHSEDPLCGMHRTRYIRLCSVGGCFCSGGGVGR